MQTVKEDYNYSWNLINCIEWILYIFYHYQK